MPPGEGLALYSAAVTALGSVSSAPMLEIGSYCGKSALYLGAAARDADRVLFALDHHRGSEENQAGWEHHDADLVDPEVGLLDTLPTFRRGGGAGVGDAAGAAVRRRLFLRIRRPPRLRVVDPACGDGWHVGHPRRVSRPCRWGSSAI